MVMGREIKGTVSRGGSSSVQYQWREVKEREVKCNVSREGKSSSQCQWKGN